MDSDRLDASFGNAAVALVIGTAQKDWPVGWWQVEQVSRNGAR